MNEVAELQRVHEKLATIPGASIILEALFALAPVGFQIYDANGRCLLVNQAFRDLFGSEPPPEYDIRRDEIAAANGMLGLVERAFAGEVISTPPIWYDARELQQVKVAEGRRVAITTTFFPLRNAAGAVAHVGIVFKDVTPEMEAVRIREEFLSVAGHELRTPLTAVQLHVELAVRASERAAPGDPSNEVRRRVQDADRLVRRLSGLVDQLLDVSRLSAGRLVLDREDVDLAKVAHEVIDRLQEEARRSDTPLALSAPPSVIGRWDRARLEQVLNNLLSNALKYGAGRPVDVRVSREDDDAIVVVRDRGIGIALEHQARIFSKFERAAPDRQFGGLGLGLWICRELVEAMHGTIAVASAPGSGAAFTIRLPRAEQDT